MQNLIIFEGRVGNDLDIKFTPNGIQYAKWSMAQGHMTKKEEKITMWVNCISYAKSMEYIKKIVKKGNRIMVQGRLNSRSYEKDGKKNTIYEIVVTQSWEVNRIVEDNEQENNSSVDVDAILKD